MKHLCALLVLISSLGAQTLPTYLSPALGKSYLAVTLDNDGSSGTTLNKLAKLSGGKAVVITTSAADTTSVIGCVKSGAGTTGSAEIAIAGTLTCLFDNTATVQGDYVIASGTTAATLHDAGSTFPGAGEVLGTVQSTNSACGSPPCGPYTVVFMTPDVASPGGGGNGGGGASSNFARITTGTNTQANMVVSSGAALSTSGSGTIAATNVTKSPSCTFNNAPSALASGSVDGVSVCYLAPLDRAGTATAWTITLAPSGTAGFRVWRVAAGTAIPTAGSNEITTADLAISSGTNLRSTSFTNFSGGTAPVFAVGDILAFQLNAASTAVVATFSIQYQ